MSSHLAIAQLLLQAGDLLAGLDHGLLIAPVLLHEMHQDVPDKDEPDPAAARSPC